MEHEKRLRAQAEANVKALVERQKRRNTRKTPQIDSSITNLPTVDQVDAIVLPVADSVAFESIPDPPVDASPKHPAKRLKAAGSPSLKCLPEQTLVFASSSSVTTGQTLSSMIPISNACPNLLGMDFSACGVQSIVHATRQKLDATLLYQAYHYSFVIIILCSWD